MGLAFRRGRQGERIALDFLKRYGLVPLEKNYRTTRGEIDLIMRDNETIVFVEVRARSDNNYMQPLESIDDHKVEHIIYASRHYLQREKLENDAYCRFDIVILTGNDRQPKIEWIKNAFEA